MAIAGKPAGLIGLSFYRYENELSVWNKITINESNEKAISETYKLSLKEYKERRNLEKESRIQYAI